MACAAAAAGPPPAPPPPPPAPAPPGEAACIEVVLHVAPAGPGQQSLRAELPPLPPPEPRTAAALRRQLCHAHPLLGALTHARGRGPGVLRLFRVGSELHDDDPVAGGERVQLLAAGLAELVRAPVAGGGARDRSAGLTGVPRCVLTHAFLFLLPVERVAAAAVSSAFRDAARAAVARVSLRRGAARGAAAFGDAEAARLLWPALASLSLCDSAVTGDTLRALSGSCRALTRLDLSGCRVLQSLEPLALPALSHLLIGGCCRLGAAAPAPAALPALTAVQLQQSAREGALGRALAAAFPRCRLTGVITLHVRGSGGGFCLRSVRADATLQELRATIGAHTGVPPERQHLVFKHKLLPPGGDTTLSGHGIGDDGQVFVTFALRSDDSADAKRGWAAWGNWGSGDGGPGPNAPL